MKSIAIGLTGEGRGHAARVKTLVDNLSQHQIYIFAPEMAYDFLQPIYSNSPVKVLKIPGLTFGYGQDGSINYGKTVFKTISFLKSMGQEVKRMVEVFQEIEPDLVITDFEPLISRAARKCNIPFISVDHQHFLKVSNLKKLPGKLKRHAWFMSLLVSLYYTGQKESIVSSFYFPPLKTTKKVTQVGVLLRREILGAKVHHGKHLVAYFRRKLPLHVEIALKSCEREVRIYGLGAKAKDGNLRFLAIDSQGFIDDLASCDALISTAGNQLLGEALYLRKPALVMPEPGNMEQEINAWFLDKSGCGFALPMANFSPFLLDQFINNLENFRTKIEPEKLNGNFKVLERIQAHLQPKIDATQTMSEQIS